MHRKLYASIVPVLLLGLLLMLTSCVAPAAPAAEAPAAEAPAAEAPAAEAASINVADLNPALAELVAAAQAEGELTTIALPRSWCNYGEVIDSFVETYGIKVNELNPDAGSGDELEAIRANKENKGPQAPDVIDVGLSFGPLAQEEGLLAPYKVSVWDSIPEGVKDVDGYWYGDYGGVLAFMVNKDIVTESPATWDDLLDPRFAGQIGLSGDPRTSNQAILAVMAASLGRGGTLDDVTPGLEFFAELNQVGNLVPTIANDALLARGETPVRIAWDYLAASGAVTLAGNPPVEVVVPPEDSRVFGVYVQGISAYAPHPNAAKLWMEHIYSDAGQMMWMRGFCHPVREADMRERGVIPDELSGLLPDISGAVYPSLAQQEAAKALIAEQWDAVVGADIKAAE